MLDLYTLFICFLVVEFTTQYTIIIVSTHHQLLYHKDGIKIMYEQFVVFIVCLLITDYCTILF